MTILVELGISFSFTLENANHIIHANRSLVVNIIVIINPKLDVKFTLSK